MKTKILIALNLLLLMSCTTNSQDIATLDFSKDGTSQLDKLSYSSKTDQKGHYEAEANGEQASFKLVDKGEKVTNYLFMDAKAAGINYAGMPVSEVTGAAVSVYEGKIAFMRIHVKNDQSFALLDILKKKLGNPTETITNKDTHFDQNDKSQLLLLQKLPNDTKKIKDDVLDEYYLSYPENFIWDKNDLIYQLTFSPTGKVVDNQLVIILKKAFRDKVIMGYHNPGQDPILHKYVN